MRITTIIVVILVGCIAGDLAPSPDVQGVGAVTQNWYKEYLERLESERIAQVKGKPKMQQPVSF